MEVQRRGPWRHPSVPCVAGPTAKVASVRPHPGRTGERGRAGPAFLRWVLHFQGLWRWRDTSLGRFQGKHWDALKNRTFK